MRWWHGAIVAGGVVGLSLLDEPVANYVQGHRSGTVDGVAGVVRRFGQPEVYATMSLGVLGVGLVSSNRTLTRAGTRLAVSSTLAWSVFHAGKFVLGRERPETTADATEFHPLSGFNQALPSGHTTMAFVLATTLADEIDRPWATVALYALATSTGLSRVNDNRHWFSDVALGTVVGITSAKLVNGRWHIFGLHPPSFLAAPKGGTGLGWSARF